MAVRTLLGVSLALATVASTALAQQGQGPVARACASDIAKYCTGKSHQNREVRTCLEANKSKVSASCKTALDTSGGGPGKGKRN